MRMKWLTVAVVTMFSILMITVWVCAERAHPVFVPQPAEFHGGR